MTHATGSADRSLWAPDAPARSAMRRLFRDITDREARASAVHPPPSPDAPYAAWHAWSCEHPDIFWPEVWRFCGAEPATVADLPRASVLRGSAMRPPGPAGPEWFSGATLNFAENLLQRGGDALAIIARCEAGTRRTLTFDELAAEVHAFASALTRAGVRAGDRVAGFMPNIPEAVIAMLGAAWIGATWTSCSPDFGVKGVLDRFGQVRPRVLVCADGYTYAGKEIDSLVRVRDIAAAIDSVEVVVVAPFLRSALRTEALRGIRGGVRWTDWMAEPGDVAAAQLPFNHPLYVMYSSGTTGLPKCMVHGAGGTLLQHLKEHQLHCDIAPGDRVFYFSTCGWMMWNWLVSALASGATIVLYDGSPLPSGAPDALWRMADEEGITVFGTSAKFLAACEAAGLAPARTFGLGALRMILSTGSPLAPHGFDYVMRDVKPGVHLASISGGTDLISCFVLGNPLEPVYRGEIQCAGLGMAVDVWDETGRPVTGTPGELVCTRPFPSMPIAFWDDADGAKYRGAYFSHFPGVWRHGDWVERTAHGSFVVHGRSDATLNPGGVRIGTAEVYREVEQVPDVVESVVVGQDVPDGHGGMDTRIVLFVRLADGVTLDDALRERIRTRLRQHASPHHVPKVIAQVRDIPRTISGKITEMAVRAAIHGREVRNTDALANPQALEEFRNRAELRSNVP